MANAAETAARHLRRDARAGKLAATSAFNSSASLAKDSAFPEAETQTIPAPPCPALRPPATASLPAFHGTARPAPARGGAARGVLFRA